MTKPYYCLLFCLFFASNLFAQDILVVKNIEIIGNRKTKEKVILRELDFRVGDTLLLDNIDEIFERNEYFLMNTNLFSTVSFSPHSLTRITGEASIKIELLESLFIYPIPIFELADRNFNVWWDEQNRDIKRINWGLRTRHTNLTGRRDELKIVTQFGYTRKLELAYNLPGLNAAKTLGLELNIFRSWNKEIGYSTQGNRLAFHRSEDEFLHRRFRTSAGLVYRPKLFTTHRGRLLFYRRDITDYVKDELNFDFLLKDQTRLNYFALAYDFVCDRRDIKPYPLTGDRLDIGIKKTGLGIFKDRNALQISAKYAQYFNFKKRWSTELITKASRALIRAQQPYFDTRALGYEDDYIRGYEYYVIDGMDYVYQKATLRYEVFDGQLNFEKIMPIEAFQKIDLRTYITFNNDFGYVNNPFDNTTNFLSNSFLWGKGFGIDFITYYSVVVQLEYSLNHELEHGFFIHFRFGG